MSSRSTAGSINENGSGKEQGDNSVCSIKSSHLDKVNPDVTEKLHKSHVCYEHGPAGEQLKQELIDASTISTWNMVHSRRVERLLKGGYITQDAATRMSIHHFLRSAQIPKDSCTPYTVLNLKYISPKKAIQKEQQDKKNSPTTVQQQQKDDKKPSGQSRLNQLVNAQLEANPNLTRRQVRTAIMQQFHMAEQRRWHDTLQSYRDAMLHPKVTAYDVLYIARDLEGSHSDDLAYITTYSPNDVNYLLHAIIAGKTVNEVLSPHPDDSPIYDDLPISTVIEIQWHLAKKDMNSAAHAYNGNTDFFESDYATIKTIAQIATIQSNLIVYTNNTNVSLKWRECEYSCLFQGAGVPGVSDIITVQVQVVRNISDVFDLTAPTSDFQNSPTVKGLGVFQDTVTASALGQAFTRVMSTTFDNLLIPVGYSVVASSHMLFLTSGQLTWSFNFRNANYNPFYLINEVSPTITKPSVRIMFDGNISIINTTTVDDLRDQISNKYNLDPSQFWISTIGGFPVKEIKDNMTIYMNRSLNGGSDQSSEPLMPGLSTIGRTGAIDNDQFTTSSKSNPANNERKFNMMPTLAEDHRHVQEALSGKFDQFISDVGYTRQKALTSWFGTFKFSQFVTNGNSGSAWNAWHEDYMADIFTIDPVTGFLHQDTRFTTTTPLRGYNISMDTSVTWAN